MNKTLMNSFVKPLRFICAVMALVMILMSFASCTDDPVNTAINTDAQSTGEQKTEAPDLSEKATFDNNILAAAVEKAVSKEEGTITLGDLNNFKVMFIGNYGINLGTASDLDAYKETISPEFSSEPKVVPAVAQYPFKEPISKFTEHDLKQFTGVRYLAIASMSGTVDLKYYAELFPNLEYLVVAFTKIESLDGIKGFKNLKGVTVGDSSLTDIDEIADMKNLEYVDFSFTKISDFSILGELKNISVMKLSSDSSLSDISFVSKLDNLQSFQCTNTSVSDISPLFGNKKLHTLNLNSNLIKDVKGISALADSLKVITISNNSVADAADFCDLKNLVSINLFMNNGIKNIDKLQKALPNAEILADDSE